MGAVIFNRVYAEIGGNTGREKRPGLYRRNLQEMDFFHERLYVSAGPTLPARSSTK